MLGVAVIGCGYWGPKLVRNFSRPPASHVTAVCDLRYERAARVGVEFHVPKVTDRPEEVIRASDVQLVVVATPSASHFEIARRALELGKHVLVMKPLTTRVDHAEELCDLADRKGVLLAVDHTFVYTGAVRKMKALIEAGEIGELYYLDSVRINLGLIQPDVSVLWDLAPHDVAIMDYLIDREPTKVSAIGASHGGSPTENIAYLTVGYDGALLAHMHVNWLAPVKVRSTIVGGSKKMMIYDDMEPSEKLKVYDKGFSIQREMAPEESAKWMVAYRSGDMHAPNLDAREALSVEAEELLAALAGRGKVAADGRAGLRVVRVLEAAQQSMEQGAVVSLASPSS
jgi:predicted dehydrogenase